MAARRLLIVMLLLLGFSILASTQVPEESLEEGTETTETEAPPPAGPERPSGGELLAQTIEVGGKTLPVVPIRVGDQLSLVVRSERFDVLEIPSLGLVAPVEPLSPARFDILELEPGTHPIRMVEADAVVARIEVSRRPGSRPSGPTAPARAEAAPGSARGRP